MVVCCHTCSVHLPILQRVTSVAMVGCVSSLCHCIFLHPSNWYYCCDHKSGWKKVPICNLYVLWFLCVFVRLQAPGLNIFTKYVIGYLCPELLVANMCFKVYGYISMTQALTFVSDFKIGHYMKIPPQSMFMAQVSSLFTILKNIDLLKE